MIDLIQSIIGPSRCGWCNRARDCNWFEHWVTADVIGGVSKRWQKVAWFLYNDISLKVGIWKWAEAWHYKFHIKENV